MSGKVYLVGAGPGDIGLLTVKGLKCLQKAQAVVYDFHLNAQVLNCISHKAEFIYAGKRGGRHTMAQEKINAILIEKAREGKVVCRLKGGDPFVFGRGGEEAEALAREGIDFEVVPGVSSAVAAPAYAGIPLTHRQYSSSFAVVPGYEDPTKKGSSINWPKLATATDTLVFLMAVKNLEELTTKLMENGRSAETPVAVIRWGTRAEQETLTGTLGDIGLKVREKEIKPPAVFIVGDVVRLRDKLKWFEKKPLFGRRILVTREHSGGFETLEEMGAEIIEFPTIEVVPPENYDELDHATDNFIEDLSNSLRKEPVAPWLLFTSANGVKYFFQRLFERGKDIRELKGAYICAIGKKTAGAVEGYGLRVDLVPDEFRAEGLIEAFKRFGGLSSMRILLPRAAEAREVFPDTVRAMGGHIDVPTAYRTIKPETKGKRLKRFLREGRITVATFTSASTFRNFLEIMGDEAHGFLSGVKIAAIGPVTAKTIEKAGHRVDIMPAASTIEALVEEIIGRLSK